jgi:hypothetical protein
VSLVVLGALSIACQTALGQRKYYEYNSPEALKLTNKRIDLLTSTSWKASEIHVVMRGNIYTYHKPETISYKTDGTYACRMLSGNWKIMYNRYLVHTAGSRKVKNQNHPLVGIYSVTLLNDSMLTLTKRHSSNGDMLSQITFFKQEEKEVADARPLQFANTLSSRKRLSASEIDSISLFSKEELFLNNWFLTNDTLNLAIADTLYKIAMNFRNPLRKVKIFHEDELVGYLSNARRFTPFENLINRVDSLAMDFIKKHQKDGASTTEISSMGPYFRQYVGYEDRGGNKVIYLNAFCRYHRKWRSVIVDPPNDPCHFRIYVNLTKRECFGFRVN